MLKKRIIPCLDVKNGRVVKGIHFENLVDAGDPAELAKQYSDEGADEIVILDITASLQDRGPLCSIVERVASKVTIPLTVGGGIRSIEDIRNLLSSGADKVALNTILISDPDILPKAADIVGSQALVASIDALRVQSGWQIRVRSARQRTSIDAIEWARCVEDLGAGEILCTSIDRDGTQSGFDTELLSAVSAAVKIPVVASGGAGSMEHIARAFTDGHADAVLAASVFHYNQIGIQPLKQFLHNNNIPVRL